MSDAPAKPRVVIDTNLFVSGLLNTQGHPFALMESLRAQAVTLMMSDEQRAELGDILSRPRLVTRYHLSQSDAQALLALVDSTCIRVPLDHPLPVAVRDPKDEAILATALEGDADYLVTGDEDLLSLNGESALGALKIVTVRDFLQDHTPR
jgi:putative PIN family toxin of toxin-antitoxin system